MKVCAFNDCRDELADEDQDFCNDSCRAEAEYCAEHGVMVECSNRECGRKFKTASVNRTFCGSCTWFRPSTATRRECAADGCAATVREESDYCTLRCRMDSEPGMEFGPSRAEVLIHGDKGKQKVMS